MDIVFTIEQRLHTIAAYNNCKPCESVSFECLHYTVLVNIDFSLYDQDHSRPLLVFKLMCHQVDWLCIWSIKLFEVEILNMYKLFVRLLFVSFCCVKYNYVVFKRNWNCQCTHERCMDETVNDTSKHEISRILGSILHNYIYGMLLSLLFYVSSRSHLFWSLVACSREVHVSKIINSACGEQLIFCRS